MVANSWGEEKTKNLFQVLLSCGKISFKAAVTGNQEISSIETTKEKKKGGGEGEQNKKKTEQNKTNKQKKPPEDFQTCLELKSIFLKFKV